MLETSAPQGFEEGWAGMVGGGGSNKHDFILVPNDCGIFPRHQRLVAKGPFLVPEGCYKPEYGHNWTYVV